MQISKTDLFHLIILIAIEFFEIRELVCEDYWRYDYYIKQVSKEVKKSEKQNKKGVQAANF